MDSINSVDVDHLPINPWSGEAQWQRVEEAFEALWDESSGLVFFPIRHHSPACSFHLKHLIRRYQPQIVLIEGPVQATPLIEVLLDERTIPPVSLYCTYEQDEGKSASYYPLLSYSPELVAMREAAALGAVSRFIDLAPPYDSELVLEQRSEQSSSQDEQMLSGSDFIQRLCERMRCRNFDELWERIFEINGLGLDSDTFVRTVFAYCTLSRFCYTDEQLLASSDLAREAHMRREIALAQATYDRVLVVSGGFHTYGLLPTQEVPKQSDMPVQVEDASPKGEISIYPMVYTYAEADRLNGYASGMPYVFYYEMAWRKLNARTPELRPYSQTAPEWLAQLAVRLRRSNESASSADAIEAARMFHDLAVLRGKREGGVYELLDASLSAFVKGEHNLGSQEPLEHLKQMLVGDGIGELAPHLFAVPIVVDFKHRCAELRLTIQSTSKQTRTLDLYSKPLHRAISRWMHAVCFLVEDFAERKAGPDWLAYRDMNRVREIWQYAYSARIEARLIECSVYGGTVREAAIRKLEMGLAAIPAHHSKALADLLLHACLMGLQEQATRLYELVEAALYQDAHFLSLSAALRVLTRMQDHAVLLGLQPDERLHRLISTAYRLTVLQLPYLVKAHAEEHQEVVQQLKLLLVMADHESEPSRAEVLREQVSEWLRVPDLPAQLEGAALALSVELGLADRQMIISRAQAYIYGTPMMANQTALYLQGLFAMSRDIFLYDSGLLTALNDLIVRLPHASFVEMVPQLRLAFTHFTAPESQIIAKRAAALYDVSEEVLQQPAYDELQLHEARIRDDAIRKEFAAWMLIEH